MIKFVGKVGKVVTSFLKLSRVCVVHIHTPPPFSKSHSPDGAGYLIYTATNSAPRGRREGVEGEPAHLLYMKPPANALCILGLCFLI